MKSLTSIEERLANRRDLALVRSSMGRMSTLADRAPIYTATERRTQMNPFLVAILAIALVLLWGNLAGTNNQPVSQVKIERHG